MFETAMICITKNTTEKKLMTTTMMTITIASNYIVPIFLYVFYCHRSCHLLSSLFFCRVIFAREYRAIYFFWLPKKPYLCLWHHSC